MTAALQALPELTRYTEADTPWPSRDCTAHSSPKISNSTGFMLWSTPLGGGTGLSGRGLLVFAPGPGTPQEAIGGSGGRRPAAGAAHGRAGQPERHRGPRQTPVRRPDAISGTGQRDAHGGLLKLAAGR